MEKLIEFFAKNGRIVNMLIFIIILTGIFSLRELRKEEMPATDIDKMLIVVNYPGASPIDVELNTVVPIEEKLRSISGIDDFLSVSTENMATISVNIDQDVSDKQLVKDEVFREITKSSISEIPEEVEKIKVINLNPKERAIFNLALSIKKDATEEDLYNLVDTFENMLRRVDGISTIDKVAFRENEVHINVFPKLLEKFYVSLADIINSVASRNVRGTGGILQSLQGDKTIVTIGQFENPLEVKDVIIRSGLEQQRIFIQDVASVTKGFEKETKRILVNGKRSVLLSIKKKPNADTVKTINNIKSFFAENRSLYESRFELTTVSDDSETISSLLSVVQSNAIIGFILVVVILFIFLDLKTSLWTAFGIPFCLLICAIFMNILDISLNKLTIGAVITVLGMLVDDAIVVAENIYEKKQMGLSNIDAAIKGSKEILIPVTVTIISTIAAFLPMMMIKGTMGKFIYVYPVVITIVLVASLFESAFILPNHLAGGKPKQAKKAQWFDAVASFYLKTLQKTLKHSYITATVFIILLVATLGVSRNTLKGFVLFWDDSSEQVVINLITHKGTSLQKTEAAGQNVEKIILETIPKQDLVSTMIYTGAHGGSMFNPETHDNWAYIQIKLVPKTKRERSASDYGKLLRQNLSLSKFPKLESLIVVPQKSGPRTGSSIDVKVTGLNEKDKTLVAKEIKEYLSTLEGVVDIDDNMKESSKEIFIDIDYKKLAQFSLNVKNISQTIRTAFEGTIASYIQTPEKKIEFRVQISPSFKIDKKYLLDLLIPNSSGRLIRLRDVAELKDRRGQVSIKHYNGDRATSVTANVDKKLTTSRIVNQALKKRFKNISKQYPVYVTYAGESKESQSAMTGLLKAFIVAITFIYLIMTVLFRSLSQPFIILSVIPFGLIGVLLAFTIHGVPLSFMGIIGIIGLSGVVINDSVIMVNYINKVFSKSLLSSRDELYKRIAEGAKKRLRPIVLTTLTTVAGLLPTVYGIGGDAKMMVPTVMAISYGLAFATVLTLYLIPSLYFINLDIKAKLSFK